jgi:hypothetical protein
MWWRIGSANGASKKKRSPVTPFVNSFTQRGQFKSGFLQGGIEHWEGRKMAAAIKAAA